MRDIHRILCPVDLSDVSRLAIDHAALIARWYEAAITALHVVNPALVPGTELALVGAAPDAILSDDELKDIREQVARCFTGRDDIEVEVVIGTGSPARQILDRARSLDADLIVIGTHGAGGFQHLVLGSVAEKVLRQAVCPVLTVPPHAHTTSALPFKRLLCPVDFSDASLAALGFAFSLAQEGNAELTLAHVLEWPAGDAAVARPFDRDDLQESERAVTRQLHDLVPDAVKEWCRPTTRIGHGKAYREILAMAAEERADLIVMGVHGRNALDVMLFGSTTNQVVRRATCPVLTLRD